MPSGTSRGSVRKLGESSSRKTKRKSGGAEAATEKAAAGAPQAVDSAGPSKSEDIVRKLAPTSGKAPPQAPTNESIAGEPPAPVLDPGAGIEASDAEPVVKPPVRHDLGMEQKLRQMEVLLNVSRRVAAVDSLDEILRTLIEITTDELDADRGTLFLNDPLTDELYSRVAQGNFQREIRILNDSGVAGAVFQTGEGLTIDDAYSDDRFNRAVDEATGYHTETIVAAPVRTVKGEVIGVIQILNKNHEQRFTRDDLELLEAMTTQAAVALQSRQYVERMQKTRE